MTGNPAPEVKPALADRVRGWLRKHDRVTVSIGTWPAANPIVTVRLFAPWRWVVAGVAAAVAAAMIVGALVKGEDVVAVLPFLAIFGFSILMVWGPTSHEWTDHVVAPAGARAARDLGTEVSPGVWRITGPEKGELAANLKSMAALDTGRNVDPDPMPAIEREREAIRMAGSVLSRYLVAKLTAAEHGNEPLGAVESDPLTPGTWPTLDPPDGTWRPLPPS
jgi:hypothetical protein